MLRGINHITIAVSNLQRSFDFYSGLLGMKPHVLWESGAYLTSGDIWFCLSLDTATPAQDYSHIALDIDEVDYDTFVAGLREAGVIEWKQNTSEGSSLYFLDPDGHKLEIHCGTLQSRLDTLKSKPYAGLTWFDY